MSAAWEALCASGVPAGAPRPPLASALDGTGVRAALDSLCATRFSALDQTMRECLLAWLRGFQHHWPARFATILGDVGRDALSHLDSPAPDPNRYLKLRRIAIENLAGAI